MGFVKKRTLIHWNDIKLRQRKSFRNFKIYYCRKKLPLRHLKAAD